MVYEKACLMKGEEELVMDEGINKREQIRKEREARQKSLFDVMGMSLRLKTSKSSVLSRNEKMLHWRCHPSSNDT